MLRRSRLGICIFTVVSASYVAGAPHTLARTVDYDPDPVPNIQKEDKKDEKTPLQSMPSVSAQQLLPSISASLPLKGFTFRSENEILDESAIKKNDGYEENANNIAAWISRSKTGTTRSEISERCEKTFGNSASPFKITNANLTCAPWMLERIAILRDSKRRAAFVKPAVHPHVKNEQQWVTLSNQNFSIAFARLDPANVNEMLAMKNMALKTQFDCKFTGATAAFIARAETFLPDERAMDSIEKLYPGAFACLEPDMDGYERTHQRVGMLRLLKGESLKARQSLLLASRAEEPKEDFRTLFWLGVIDENEPLLSQDLQAAGVKRNYWKELHERHLLSLHSVLAAHYQGRDPMDMTTRGSEIKVNRRIGEGASEFNMVAFVFELLIARGDTTALAQWSQFVSRTLENTDTKASVFLALAHNKAQNFRGSIAAITQFLRDTKNSQISPELIQLYFPRPYTEEILANSNNIDPVLVFALIRQESAFEPLARSSADARGLMQVLPGTARKFIGSRGDLYEPSANVKAGVGHLADLLKKYNGRVEHVLAAYNAGAKHVEKWKGRFPLANILLFSDLIPFKETRTYVSIIQRNAYWYGRFLVLSNDDIAKTVIKKAAHAKWRPETVSQLLNVAWAKDNPPAAKSALASLYSLADLSHYTRIAATRTKENDVIFPIYGNNFEPEKTMTPNLNELSITPTNR